MFQYLSLQSNLKHGWFTRKFANHIWTPRFVSIFLALKQGREAESSYEPGGSDVVRELSREPAMFQIGL